MKVISSNSKKKTDNPKIHEGFEIDCMNELEMLPNLYLVGQIKYPRKYQ